MGDVAGDLVFAKEAGPPAHKAGDPANDVRDGLDAGRIGLWPALEAGRRPGEEDFIGTLQAAMREGLDSREATALLRSIMTQLAPNSASPFSRCNLFAGRLGVVWS